jgi:hypothetical protein
VLSWVGRRLGLSRIPRVAKAPHSRLSLRESSVLTGLRLLAQVSRRNRGVSFTSDPGRDGARSTLATTELSRSERRLWPLNLQCQSPQRRILRWPGAKEPRAQSRQIPRRNEIPAYVWQLTIHTDHMPIHERARVRGCMSRGRLCDSISPNSVLRCLVLDRAAEHARTPSPNPLPQGERALIRPDFVRCFECSLVLTESCPDRR